MDNCRNSLADLPIEVITNILNFLPHTDLMIMRQVCKYFYFASIDRSIIQREAFIFKKSSVYQETNVASILMNSVRPFYTFKFVGVDFSSELCLLFDKFGPKLRNLSFIECDIKELEFTHIISKCINLHSLYLSACKSLFISGTIFSHSPLHFQLPTINVLTLENCNYLSDDLFGRFAQIFPNVHSLSLKLCVICYHSALYKRFYNFQDYNVIDKPSKCVLTICYVLQIITSMCKQLKKLDFSYTYMDNVTLRTLCTLKELKLESLNLAQCYQLSKNIPLELGTWQPGITNLNISDCMAITDEAFYDICTHMFELRELSISQCQCLSDNGIVNLKLLKKLYYLDISYCTLITGAGMVNGICQQEYLPMQVFNAKYVRMGEMDIKTIIESFVNVVKLNLTNCGVTNNTLKEIFENHTILTELKIGECIMISDEGITGLERPYITSLMEFLSVFNGAIMSNEHIDKKDISRICDQLNLFGCYNNNSIGNLQALTYLDLYSCPNISDISLQLALNLSNIRAVDVKDTRVTSIGLYFLVVKCPLIEYLNVSNCDIDDKAINFTVEHLKRLKVLYVKNCRRLTDATIESIIQHCKMIRELDFDGCYRMKPQVLDRLSLLTCLHDIRRRSNINDVMFDSIPMPPIPIVQ